MKQKTLLKNKTEIKKKFSSEEWALLTPKEKCGQWLQIERPFAWNSAYDEPTVTKHVACRCTKPECPNHKPRRLLHRCHRRDHEDYAVIVKDGYKKIEILENTCTRVRYARARLRLESYFRNHDDVRYAVFTSKPVWLDTREDLVRWVDNLVKCLSIWTRDTKRRRKKIDGCVINIDPIKNPDGSYHLHGNVVWVGEFILKSELEKRWAKFRGGFVKVYRRKGKNRKGHTLHYIAKRTAIMNEPDKKQKTTISEAEYNRVFKGVKFVRYRFWKKKEKRETEFFIRAWLDTIALYCKICGSRTELIYLDLPTDVQKSLLKWKPPPPKLFIKYRQPIKQVFLIEEVVRRSVCTGGKWYGISPSLWLPEYEFVYEFAEREFEI